MSKQWTRNYDNLFVACFGFEQFGESNNNYVDIPDHNSPYFRMTDGKYALPVCSTRTYKAILNDAVSIPKPSKYGVPSFSLTSNSNYYSEVSIQIGTGTSTPTKEDYVLEMPITANVSLGTVSTSVKYDSDTHIYTRTYKIPILYSGSDPITIGEYGIFVGLQINGGNQYKTMVYRETLDEPVTLEQNDTIEITFSQSIMQPNYSDYPTAE